MSKLTLAIAFATTVMGSTAFAEDIRNNADLPRPSANRKNVRRTWNE